MSIRDLNNDFEYLEAQGEVFENADKVDISKIKAPFKISQSLIKECEKKQHCPKQIKHSFIENKELFQPSDVMLIGRYFESELLGACRGGAKEKALFTKINIKPSKSANKPIIEKFLLDRNVDISDCRTKKDLENKLQFEPSEYVDGEKLKAYSDCDKLIQFAIECFEKLGIDISKGESQKYIESELLSGNLDHVNENFVLEKGDGKCIIDVKWTGAKIDDKWNGWDAIEYKDDSITQAVHYVLTYEEITGDRIPFYFFVFGKDYWFRIFEIVVTDDMINNHKSKIQHTANLIREYSENEYKGNGNFNKCNKCPFKDDCEDRELNPIVEVVEI